MGCNASHGTLRSPIFDDGRFEFLPIPEKAKGISCFPACTLLPKYSDLKSFYDSESRLLRYIPKSQLRIRVHNDPEFLTFTYGDYPTRSPRSANLKKLDVGDYLFFLARLVLWKANTFTQNAGFFLVGFFEIEEIVKEVNSPLSSARFNNNAHVKRALVRHEFWDRFWIFKGSNHSRRFPRAVPFTRSFAGEVMLDRRHQPWRWDYNRSELQVIGSYTRSCRVIEKEDTVARFWNIVDKASSGVS